MNLSLQENSTRIMEALLSNPNVIEWYWNGIHMPKDIQRALAGTAVELALTMNDAIVACDPAQNGSVDTNQQPVVGGPVSLAYYHSGFTDDPPILLDVCESEAVASTVIEAHKQNRDRASEYKDKATWWTTRHAIRTTNTT